MRKNNLYLNSVNYEFKKNVNATKFLALIITIIIVISYGWVFKNNEKCIIIYRQKCIK